MSAQQNHVSCTAVLLFIVTFITNVEMLNKLSIVPEVMDLI